MYVPWNQRRWIPFGAVRRPSTWFPYPLEVLRGIRAERDQTVSKDQTVSPPLSVLPSQSDSSLWSVCPFL